MARTREKKIAAPVSEAVARLTRMIKEPTNEPTRKEETIAQRLERRFGLGSQPDLRRRLFARLGLACEVHGEHALKQLQIVVAESAQARKPDRYFCRAALLRLREQNLMEMEEIN